MNLNSFYGLEKVRKDKNIFQTFANKTEMNNHLLNIGLISLEEFRKREHGRLSHRELDNLIETQTPF